MGKKTIPLSRFGPELRKLPPELADATVRGLRSAALRGVGIVVQEIDNAKPHPAVNNGQLRQSVKYHALPDGAEIVVEAPHAPMIEYGTRPFTPPLAPLVAWVLRKGFADTEQEAIRIARGVQRAIAARGIEPRHFFAKAMARVRVIAVQEVKRELEAL